MKSLWDLKRWGTGALAVVLMAALAGGGCGQSTRHAGDWSPSEFDQADYRPPTPKTLAAMGRILAAQGKDSEAVFVLNRLIREHPDYLPAYNELAELHLQRGRVEAALEVLERGLARAPEDAVLLNNVGMCYLSWDEPEQALGAFWEAAKAAPRDERIQSNIALATAMMGDYEDALAMYEGVMSEADAHYNLGVVAESRGDYQRAASEYQRAQELNRRLRVRSDLERVSARLGNGGED